jgi:hypothetical protein
MLRLHSAKDMLKTTILTISREDAYGQVPAGDFFTTRASVHALFGVPSAVGQGAGATQRTSAAARRCPQRAERTATGKHRSSV